MDSRMWMIVIVEGLAVSIIGSLLHFVYEWSNKNKFVGIFAAVNESTWEHVKLALSGIFICTLVDVWWLGSNPNYWLARSVSFVVPVVVIPLIFYSYTKLTGKPILPVDIGTFIIASFLSALAFVLILQAPAVGEVGGIVSIFISVIIIAMYLLLTRFPLHDLLFRDPRNNKYGYAAFSPLKKKNKSKKKRK